MRKAWRSSAARGCPQPCEQQQSPWGCEHSASPVLSLLLPAKIPRTASKCLLQSKGMWHPLWEMLRVQ